MKIFAPHLTKLNCIFFIHTESSSDLVEGTYGNTNSRLIYGVFSTPNNAIAGSAICAFSLQVKYI
jgi:semaphorin 6